MALQSRIAAVPSACLASQLKGDAMNRHTSCTMLYLCLAATMAFHPAIAGAKPATKAHGASLLRTPGGTDRAEMQTMQIASHGALMNALVYVAAGAGPHPAVILLHGFPGNERNLDLAQDMRRAGWDVSTSTTAARGARPGISLSPMASRTPPPRWHTCAGRTWRNRCDWIPHASC